MVILAWIAGSVGVVLGLLRFLQWQNKGLSVSRYTIQDPKIPVGFHNWNVLHLSDLHSTYFGHNQQTLIRRIKKLNPDVIFFTGDIVDKRRYQIQPALSLIEQLTPLFQVYYVTGNHEWQSKKWSEVEPALRERGVHLLSNTAVYLERKNDRLALLGIHDQTSGKKVADSLLEAKKDVPPHVFQCLLAHRPSRFPVYVEAEVNAVFCGHAHGGQWRIPGFGGLYGPDDGWNPMYTEGVHKQNKTTMVISRGLGNSGFPLRLFNRPELVLVTFKKE